MTEVNLEFLARQNERILQELAEVRQENAHVRTELTELMVLVSRIKAHLGRLVTMTENMTEKGDVPLVYSRSNSREADHVPARRPSIWAFVPRPSVRVPGWPSL
jgi:hypothetical protein